MNMMASIPPACEDAGLADRYAGRREGVMAALARFDPVAGWNLERDVALERALHLLAGVAGLFGERPLGLLAAEAVAELRRPAEVRSVDSLLALRDAMLLLGGRPWPAS